MKNSIFFPVIAFLIVSPSFANQKSDAKLKFTPSVGAVRELSLEELTQSLGEAELLVQSAPAYGGKSKKFIGFDFAKLLKKLDPSLELTRPFSVKITTLDGWNAPPYSSDVLLRGNALLAVREAKETITSPASEDGFWTIAVDGKTKKHFYPGPFYLVWNAKGKNPDIMPLQVASIQIVPSK